MGMKREEDQRRLVVFHAIHRNYRPFPNDFGLVCLWINIINISISVIHVNVYGVYRVLIRTISADLLTDFLIDLRIIYKVFFEGYRKVGENSGKNTICFVLLGIVGYSDILEFPCGV